MFQIDPSIPRITYSDINVFADIENTDVVLNSNSVQQSVLLILATPKRSRWWRPDFGSNVSAILFEPMDEVTEQNLKYAIVDALRDPANNEWRVAMDDVQIIADKTNSQYYVKMQVNIPTLNTSEQLEFLLERAA